MSTACIIDSTATGLIYILLTSVHVFSLGTTDILLLNLKWRYFRRSFEKLAH
jgi:hypothetical protein